MPNILTKLTEFWGKTKRNKGALRNGAQGHSSPAEGEDEIDFCSAQDLTGYLQNDIRRLKGGKQVFIKEKEVKKFLEKSKIHLVRVKSMSSKKPKRLISEKKHRFKNSTANNVSHTFRKSFQETASASLTVTKGYTIGIGATLGGSGMGASASGGLSGAYRKEKQFTHEQSKREASELQTELTVPSGKSIIAMDRLYGCDYDAMCEFEIALQQSHKIKYELDGRKDTVTAEELKKLNEKHASEISGSQVQLQRTWSCTIEHTEPELDIKMANLEDLEESNIPADSA